MGDRGNIEIRFVNGKNIYYYGHWSGSELPFVVAKGLTAGQGRWGDECYLARIIFCHMLNPQDLHSELGFGIAPWFAGDVEHPIVVVDMQQKAVGFLPLGRKNSDTFERIPGKIKEWFQFDRYVELMKPHLGTETLPSEFKKAGWK